MNQHAKIRAYLDAHGSITPMEAFEHLRITKLSTRVGEMIAAGEKIEKVMELKINQDGDVVRYMRYFKKVV